LYKEWFFKFSEFMPHKFCEAPTLPQVLVKVNHEILKKKKSIEKLNKRDFEYWTSSDLLFSSSF